MTVPECRRIETALARRSGPGGDVRSVADAIVALWRDIELQLTPIIGPRGVAALHRRSLFLTAREHAWLAVGPDGATLANDLDALRSLLHQQDVDVAMTGGNALFLTFHDLLTSMVGPALTERLLRDVWDPSPSDTFAQDTEV